MGLVAVISQILMNQCNLALQNLLYCYMVGAQPGGGSMQPWKTPTDGLGSSSDLEVFVLPRFEVGSGLL